MFAKVGATADPPFPNCHPDRFRDTFAVSLLLKGVLLDSVSKLLGHSSINIIERHYCAVGEAAAPRGDRGRPVAAVAPSDTAGRPSMYHAADQSAITLVTQSLRRPRS